MINSKKGFTLIELLAVIVILGVLMLIGIPMMTTYIENSKKDAFISNAKTYITQARNDLLSGKYDNCDFPAGGQSVYLQTSNLELEKGIVKDGGVQKNVSPYNTNMTISYVKVTASGNATTVNPTMTYSYAGVDEKGNGIPNFVDENSLKRSDVKKGTTFSGGTITPCN